MRQLRHINFARQYLCFPVGLWKFLAISVPVSLIFSAAFSGALLAYDQFSTHPELTAEIARLYNFKKSSQHPELRAKDIDALRLGAIQEDEPPRWINHFYDPVHNVAWTGKNYGNLSVQEGKDSTKGLNPPLAPIPSITWSRDQRSQAQYVQHGNQTWDKAIALYLAGRLAEAFKNLGHILHLIEDAAVPDHTRDDPHPHLYGDPGSPLEIYAAKLTRQYYLNVADNLKGQSLPQVTDIKAAIRTMAVYSNSNFFSEDTITNEDFALPDLTSKKLVRKLQTANGKEDKYFYNTETGIYLAKITSEGKFTVSDDSFVLPSYTNHLFPRIVSTGAAAIELFFNEVERYQNDPGLIRPKIVPDITSNPAAFVEMWPEWAWTWSKSMVVTSCELFMGDWCKDTLNAQYNETGKTDVGMHTAEWGVQKINEAVTDIVPKNSNDFKKIIFPENNSSKDINNIKSTVVVDNKSDSMFRPTTGTISTVSKLPPANFGTLALSDKPAKNAGAVKSSVAPVDAKIIAKRATIGLSGQTTAPKASAVGLPKKNPEALAQNYAKLIIENKIEEKKDFFQKLGSVFKRIAVKAVGAIVKLDLAVNYRPDLF